MTSPLELWLVTALAVIATYFWRGLGVTLSARLDPDGLVFEWVSCVSYAMLAGLIARMTVIPLGGLAETALLDRLLAMGLAFLLFFTLRERILPAVAAGAGLFILLTAGRQQGWL